MNHTSLEQIWAKYPNKYKALNLAALLVRELIEAHSKSETRPGKDVYEEALRKLVETELKYEKLSPAEVEALTREGFGEQHTRTWREPTAFGRTFF